MILNPFQALMAEINLNEDLVYYFGLFLIKRADDGEAASKLISYQFHELLTCWHLNMILLVSYGTMFFSFV